MDFYSAGWQFSPRPALLSWSFLCACLLRNEYNGKISESGILSAHFGCDIKSVLMEADISRIGPGIPEKEKIVPQKPDTVLVKAAVNGDAESFDELAQRYYPAMVAIAHSILGDRHLAEDAAQQAFAKAALKLPQLKKENRFAHWLAVICRNAARDMARRAENLNVAEDLSSIAARSDRDDKTDAVRQALERLSAPAREVIFLRFYDGMSDYLRRNGFGEV
jgi:RNA polymerase sigma-70 factor (ECF subfamily)